MIYRYAQTHSDIFLTIRNIITEIMFFQMCYFFLAFLLNINQFSIICVTLLNCEIFYLQYEFAGNVSLPMLDAFFFLVCFRECCLKA